MSLTEIEHKALGRCAAYVFGSGFNYVLSFERASLCPYFVGVGFPSCGVCSNFIVKGGGQVIKPGSRVRGGRFSPSGFE